jgi:hypothetical protein
LGIDPDHGCSCESRAKQMDRWGVDGCREHFEEIRTWLQDAQAKSTWRQKLTAAVKAATSGLALQLNPLDVAGSIVRLAIERANSPSEKRFSA